MSGKIFVLSDSAVASGYGRIADETMTRLHRRGYEIMAASLQYDGLLPAVYEGKRLPYHVAALAAHRGAWLEPIVRLIEVAKPDVVVVIQDAPYSEMLRAAPVDWSAVSLVACIAVDGTPVKPTWIETARRADAALTISRFGVEAFRQQGIAVGLCQPGVDSNVFYRDAQRAALRERLGIDPDAFVLGSACANQGRKSISLMLKAFFEFAKGRKARYLIDTEPDSAAGWNIPELCQMYEWDASRLIFRSDAQAAGLMHLRDRYNVMDAHAVISHREGFGLPLVEAMACGVVSMALDYCSGAEIVGEGRGVLVKAIDYAVPGTWGGAEDRFVDLQDFVQKLIDLHDRPDLRRTLAEAGMAWARQQSWDTATDAMQSAIDQALEKQRRLREKLAAVAQPPPVEVRAQNGGVALVEAV